MPSVLNTNMASISAQRYLTLAQSKLGTSYERLSSGSRINRAQDDAAGLGIAQNLTASLGGTSFAIRNANDAIGTLQTAEGALAEVSTMLQRFKELATQGNNQSLSGSQRAYLSNEMVELANEITAIANRTKFNGNALLGTTFSGAVLVSAKSLQFQTGVDASDVQTIDFVRITVSGDAFDNLAYLVSADSAKVVGLNVKFSASVATVSAFSALTPIIESAINEVAALRAAFGAKVNRINSNLSNLDALSENLSAARSRVLDTDYAAETAMLTRTQILQQAATAMLSQANAQPNVILALLK
jgi:flagellin